MNTFLLQEEKLRACSLPYMGKNLVYFSTIKNWNIPLMVKYFLVQIFVQDNITVNQISFIGRCLKWLWLEIHLRRQPNGDAIAEASCIIHVLCSLEILSSGVDYFSWLRRWSFLFYHLRWQPNVDAIAEASCIVYIFLNVYDGSFIECVNTSGCTWSTKTV